MFLTGHNCLFRTLVALCNPVLELHARVWRAHEVCTLGHRRQQVIKINNITPSKTCRILPWSSLKVFSTQQGHAQPLTTVQNINNFLLLFLIWHHHHYFLHQNSYTLRNVIWSSFPHKVYRKERLQEIMGCLGCNSATTCRVNELNNIIDFTQVAPNRCPKLYPSAICDKPYSQTYVS